MEQEIYTALWDFSQGTEGEEREREGHCDAEGGGGEGCAGGRAEAEPVTSGDEHAAFQRGGVGGVAGVGAESAATLELTLPTNWGRCCRLLQESQEFILKGKERDEYLRLHPEIALFQVRTPPRA